MLAGTIDVFLAYSQSDKCLLPSEVMGVVNNGFLGKHFQKLALTRFSSILLFLDVLLSKNGAAEKINKKRYGKMGNQRRSK